MKDRVDTPLLKTLSEDLQELGDPIVVKAGRGQILLWDCRLAGQAIVMARSAARASEGALIGQVREGLRVFGAAGIAVGAVVIAAGVSGAAPSGERPDLAMLEKRVCRGLSSAVHWSRTDRIARRSHVVERHLDFLHGRDASLFLAGRQCDLGDETERLMLRLLTTIDEEICKSIDLRLGKWREES